MGPWKLFELSRNSNCTVCYYTSWQLQCVTLKYILLLSAEFDKKMLRLEMGFFFVIRYWEFELSDVDSTLLNVCWPRFVFKSSDYQGLSVVKHTFIKESCRDFRTCSNNRLCSNYLRCEWINNFTVFTSRIITERNCHMNPVNNLYFIKKN